MQVFWLPNGMGNCQIGFPFTWLIPEQRWVPRNSTFLRPPDAQHRAETWNIVCSRCHSTAPEPHLNRQERTFATQVAEFGISCEACHGPAERHVALERDRRKQGLAQKDPRTRSRHRSPGEARSGAGFAGLRVLPFDEVVRSE
jgi:hypothetical protein